MKSADPPGADATMKRMGFTGYDCAEDGALKGSVITQIAAMIHGDVAGVRMASQYSGPYTGGRVTCKAS